MNSSTNESIEFPRFPKLANDSRQEKLLKETIGRCPNCLKKSPAKVVARDGAVFMRRLCLEHGETETRISSDARFYWLAVGNRAASGSSCCSGSCNASQKSGTLGVNATATPGAPFETLSTCLALIEIVHSCNLACPTCYADSPQNASVNAVPLHEVKKRIEGVIARKGGIEILQLSGGEPTLHPQFFELLQWAQEHSRIDYILINTNGVRIATDAEFAENLRIAATRKKLQLYLQFDGEQAEEQHALRGADLRRVREQTLAHCVKFQLPVTLAMTVTHGNLSFVWGAIEFGLRHPHIHGITLQPAFNSGRKTFNPAIQKAKEPLTAADVILGAVAHSNGALKPDDFTPLPCGDPHCAIIGYLLRTPFGVRSISDFVDFTTVQGFLKDKLHYTLEDLAQCGCDNEPLGELLKQLELESSLAFRVVIKPFMDARTWDEDRIDRCCTHVIRPDGKLDSFCRYYSGFPNARDC
jgi:uncharacterized radical SAM superfamily Fe-S cluster-containing enzyme